MATVTSQRRRQSILQTQSAEGAVVAEGLAARPLVKRKKIMVENGSHNAGGGLDTVEREF